MGAWNVNLERDFADVDHHHFVCDISDLKAKGVDSIFLFVTELIPPHGTSSYKGYKIKMLDITDSTSNEISVYSGLTSNWDNLQIDYQEVVYGFTKMEFDKALDELNTKLIDANSKGFPFTNHLTIPAVKPNY